MFQNISFDKNIFKTNNIFTNQDFSYSNYVQSNNLILCNNSKSQNPTTFFGKFAQSGSNNTMFNDKFKLANFFIDQNNTQQYEESQHWSQNNLLQSKFAASTIQVMNYTGEGQTANKKLDKYSNLNDDIVLGYWGIQGMGQSVRYLLSYLNLKYEDKHYTDSKEWFEKDKKNLKTNFPNLPYLKNGDRVVTESFAIMLYLCIHAQRMDLYGKSPYDKVHLEQLRGVQADMDIALSEIAYKMKYEEYLEKKFKVFEEKVIPKVNLLYKDFGNNKYLLGDNLSYLDFKFVQKVQQLAQFDPDFYKKYPKFDEYQKRIMDLPGIKEFRQSEKFKPDVWHQFTNVGKELKAKAEEANKKSQ